MEPSNFQNGNKQTKKIFIEKNNYLPQNDYKKKESVFDYFEYNSILPNLNQKASLSNSGRNIVLNNSLINDTPVRNNDNYANFNNFTNNFDNNRIPNNNQEKEKLDYELSRLEDQYKDILSKFTFLTKKKRTFKLINNLNINSIKFFHGSFKKL